MVTKHQILTLIFFIQDKMILLSMCGNKLSLTLVELEKASILTLRSMSKTNSDRELAGTICLPRGSIGNLHCVDVRVLRPILLLHSYPSAKYKPPALLINLHWICLKKVPLLFLSVLCTTTPSSMAASVSTIGAVKTPVCHAFP